MFKKLHETNYCVRIKVRNMYVHNHAHKLLVSTCHLNLSHKFLFRKNYKEREKKLNLNTSMYLMLNYTKGTLDKKIAFFNFQNRSATAWPIINAEQFKLTLVFCGFW
jgi:hypothetical protein